MPIKQVDLKLLASKVPDDVPEGGGGPSSVVILDGESNALIPDISQGARTRGRAYMRQAHLSVQSQDTSTYMDAGVFIAEPPLDPNVSVTLFAADDVYETRAQAKSRLEGYVQKGAEWGGFLYGDHGKGLALIQIMVRPGAALPEEGQVLALAQNEGLPNAVLEYLRVTRVTSVERTFTYGDPAVDYKAVIATLYLANRLVNEFTGTSANRTFARTAGAAVLRDTVAADSALYFGVSAAKKAAALGDFTVVAKTIFTQLVPSAQTETPIPAAVPYASVGMPVAGREEVTFTTDQAWGATTNLSLPGGCTPGSLKIRISSGAVITDAAGSLVIGASQVGTVDYGNGIAVSLTGSYAGTKTITYRPAAYLQRMPQSSEILVTASSRSQSYVGFIEPLAARGTLTFSYRAQGRWYVLSDSGDGKLHGADPSHGAGTYSADTGSYVITLGALPDVGSSIVIQWGVPTQETVHSAVDLLISQTIALALPAGTALYPGAFDIKWMDGLTQRTATANAAWQLQGDATGEVRLGRSEVLFAPKLLPAVGTVLDVTVDTAPAVEVTLQHPSRNGLGRLAVSAGQGALVPHTVEVEWNTLTDQSVLGTYTKAQLTEMGVSLVDPTQIARDDGAGKLMLGGVQVGTINYSAGTLDFAPDVTVKLPKPVYSASVSGGSAFFGTAQYRLNYEGMEYRDAPSVYPNDESGYVKLRFRTTGSATRRTLQIPFEPAFDLVAGVQAPVVPGSVLLVPSSGQPWSELNGSLRVLTAGGFVNRGTVNYATGRVVLTSWTAGSANSLRRASCITTLGDAISSAFVFRTAAAPLRPGSLTVQVPRAGGGVQNVTAGTDGVIAAPGVVGTVDVETGLVRLGFGALVVAAGNEAEPWYDAGKVQSDGKIFKPQPVVASAMRYSAVAYSFIPVNAELVGIDSVRLPSDGRVPMFRAGTMVLVGHTKTSAAMDVSNGQTVNLARTRLSRVNVRDANGKGHLLGFTPDLEAGLVKFTDVAAMTMPIVIEDRIEDRAIATDVQISGEITLNKELTHNYPLEGTFISGVLEAGDRHARVSRLFDQQSWDGTSFKDSPDGPVAVASYDDSKSPIEVTNVGATSMRWAIHFLTATTFRVIGEKVGVIATGDINTDCAPLNPFTGKPYFVLKALGWGQDWIPQNLLRFDTVGALFSFWVVSTVQPGPETGIEHSFSLLQLGDVDRP